MTQPLISAADNPAAAMAHAQAALSDAPVAAPTPPAPANTLVELPGGYVDLARQTVATQAEVRELNGEDEEAIARVVGNAAKVMDVILTRGVVSVGTEKATPDLLAALLAADRDALLIGIRRATFGDEIPLQVRCPECGAEQDTVIDLIKDVPTSELKDRFADRQFTVELSNGRVAEVSLLTGDAQRALASAEELNQAVLNTTMLHNCVQKIGGFPVVSREQVRQLSLRDRDAILKAVRDRTPGPRLGEVKRPCSTCEADIPLPLSMVDLFRL